MQTPENIDVQRIMRSQQPLQQYGQTCWVSLSAAPSETSTPYPSDIEARGSVGNVHGDPSAIGVRAHKNLRAEIEALADAANELAFHTNDEKESELQGNAQKDFEWHKQNAIDDGIGTPSELQFTSQGLSEWALNDAIESLNKNSPSFDEFDIKVKYTKFWAF